MHHIVRGEDQSYAVKGDQKNNLRGDLAGSVYAKKQVHHRCNLSPVTY